MLRLLFLLSLLSLSAQALTVAVVKSDSLEPYARALSAFAAASNLEIIEYDLQGDESRALKAFAHLKENKPALVWALGPLAATMARRELPSVPLVFSLVPTHERYALEGPLVTGISLTPSARARVELLSSLLTSVRKVGVLYDPRHAGLFVEEARRAFVEKDMELVASPVRQPSELRERFAELGAIDLLWLVPDRTTNAVEMLEPMLELARAASLPVLVLTDEQVRAGAFLSLSADIEATGRQAAQIAQRILREKVLPKNIPIADPAGFELSLNITTARALKQGKDLALEVFVAAARRSFPVKVHE